MPDDVIWQAKHAVSCALCHFREAFGLGLVLECVAGEVDAGAMDVCFDDDVDAADAVEGNFFVLVGAPVAHLGHVAAVGGELLVAFCEDDVFPDGGSEFETLRRLLPRVVVNWCVLANACGN